MVTKRTSLCKGLGGQAPLDLIHQLARVHGPKQDEFKTAALQTLINNRAAAGDDPDRNLPRPVCELIDIGRRIVAGRKVGHEKARQEIARFQAFDSTPDGLMCFDIESLFEQLSAKQRPSLPIFSR